MQILLSDKEDVFSQQLLQIKKYRGDALELDKSILTPIQVKRLFAVLNEHPFITSLFAYECTFKDSPDNKQTGIAHFAEELRHNHTLKSLDLPEKPISEKDEELLLNVIISHPKLKKLSVSISEHGLIKLLKNSKIKEFTSYTSFKLHLENISSFMQTLASNRFLKKLSLHELKFIAPFPYVLSLSFTQKLQQYVTDSLPSSMTAEYSLRNTALTWISLGGLLWSSVEPSFSFLPSYQHPNDDKRVNPKIFASTPKFQEIMSPIVKTLNQWLETRPDNCKGLVFANHPTKEKHYERKDSKTTAAQTVSSASAITATPLPPAQQPMHNLTATGLFKKHAIPLNSDEPSYFHYKYF